MYLQVKFIEPTVHSVGFGLFFVSVRNKILKVCIFLNEGYPDILCIKGRMFQFFVF